MSESTRPCEICGRPIEPERLEAVPETRLCVEHGRKVQKFGNEFKVTAQRERTSKPGSLKRNYGSVTTTKTRNEDALRKLREEYEGEQQKG